MTQPQSRSDHVPGNTTTPNFIAATSRDGSAGSPRNRRFRGVQIRQRRTSLQQPRAMAVRGPREIEDFGGCKYDNAELHCSNLARWQCGVPAKSKISGGANTTTPNFIAATSRDGSAGSPRNRRFRGVQIRQRRISFVLVSVGHDLESKVFDHVIGQQLPAHRLDSLPRFMLARCVEPDLDVLANANI